MPKIMLTDKQRQDDRLRRNLMLLKGSHTNEEMGAIIGKNKGTFQSRMNSPGELKIDELTMLCKYFKVDMGDFLKNELRIG